MRTLLFILISCSVAMAGTVMIDADGHVLSASEGQLNPDTDTTVITVPGLSTISNKDPIIDDLGRCRWKAVAGQVPTKLAAAEWPKGALKVDTARRLIDKADALLATIARLERWQADTELVAALDRSVELSEALAKLAELRAALTGK